VIRFVQQEAGEAQETSSKLVCQSGGNNAANATQQVKDYLQSMADVVSATATSLQNSVVGNVTAAKDTTDSALEQTTDIGNQKFGDAQEAMENVSLSAQEKSNMSLQQSGGYLQAVGDSVSSTVTSTVQTAKEIGINVGNQIVQTAIAVKDAVIATTNQAADVTVSAGNAVADKLAAAKNTTVKTASDACSATAQKLQETSNLAAEKAAAAKDTTVRAASDSYDFAANKAAAAHDMAIKHGQTVCAPAAEQVGKACDYAVGIGNIAAEKTATTRDDIVQYAAQAKETLGKVANDAASTLQQQSADLSAQSQQSAQQNWGKEKRYLQSLGQMPASCAAHNPM